ncbi:hypothetical protein RDI58_029191 [Solanum bulbocastanum]|uniref:Uncharacterized protein n=1 Tax=Solanum bulbocastanum TaxID=147425 RepID=A0AAN8Y064_SOLBU
MIWLLIFIDGDEVLTVQIEEADIKEHVKTWESSLIGYVLGVIPSINQLKNYAVKMWKVKPKQWELDF